MIAYKGRVGVLSAMKMHAKKFLRYAGGYVIARPKLRNSALMLLDCLPGLKSRLSRILVGGTAPQFATAHMPEDLASLTPRARQIYADLKAAVKHRREDKR